MESVELWKRRLITIYSRREGRTVRMRTLCLPSLLSLHPLLLPFEIFPPRSCSSPHQKKSPTNAKKHNESENLNSTLLLLLFCFQCSINRYIRNKESKAGQYPGASHLTLPSVSVSS